LATRFLRSLPKRYAPKHKMLSSTAYGEAAVDNLVGMQHGCVVWLCLAAVTPPETLHALNLKFHPPFRLLNLHHATSWFSSIDPSECWDKNKGKAVPVTGRGGPYGCETSRLTNGGEVVSLMHRPRFAPRNIRGTQGHSAAGRIRSVEKSNDMGNRTCDLKHLRCSVL
jgi:hypothetical protein